MLVALADVAEVVVAFTDGAGLPDGSLLRVAVVSGIVALSVDVVTFAASDVKLYVGVVGAEPNVLFTGKYTPV